MDNARRPRPGGLARLVVAAWVGVATDKLLAAIERGDYDTAGKEMMDSKWARSDSPARAQRLRKMMVRG